MAWLSISLVLEASRADAFSDALLELGAHSVHLKFGESLARIAALAPCDSDPARIVHSAAEATGIAPPTYHAGRIEDEDWVRRSQSQFGPIRISERLWIVPSWHAPPDTAAVAVRLDPGLAFGTGSHASTRMILRQLESVVRPGMRVLDYGCGSGILAIVAGKFGAREIAATDIDPQALATSIANAADNDVILNVAAPESLPPGTFDLVLANILAGPLIDLEPLLAARTRPGGRILLSGILDSQAAEVVAAYARDFEAGVIASEEGWALVGGGRK